MRFFYSFFLCFLFSISSVAQVNLVPNPSFEDTIYCPFALAQIDACASWSSFGKSPDYFNACNNGGLNVPNSTLGYQYAHSGNGFAGLATYRRPDLPSGPNYREFIGCQLLNPMIIGNKYYFSFFANFSDRPNLALGSNKLGFNCYTQPYSTCCPPSLTNNPLFYSDSILIDSVAWIKFEGSFIADSNYQFISIGNFFTDQFTDTINLSTFPDAAYYYIDDVCVTSDSIYNNSWTGLADYVDKDDIELFPNPTNSILNINSSSLIRDISIFDSIGKRMLTQSQNPLSEEKNRVNLSSLNAGVYLINIRFENNRILTKKIIVIH